MLLPLLFGASVLLETPRAVGKWRHAARKTWAMWLSLGIYLALRVQSGAFGPSDPPAYYQFTLSPAIVGRNVLEYADRGTAVAAAASVVAVVISGGWARLEPAEQYVMRLSGLWFGATYLLTMFLPSRSSLYALLPSIGSALAAGALAAASARKNSVRFRRAATVLVALAVVLVPVYRSRNIHWVALADLSADALRTMQLATAGFGDRGHVRLMDDRSTRDNLESAFGSGLNDALAIHLGEGWSGSLDTTRPSIDGRPTVSFALRNGHLTRARGSDVR